MIGRELPHAASFWSLLLSVERTWPIGLGGIDALAAVVSIVPITRELPGADVRRH
jgi:hypothetical protein